MSRVVKVIDVRPYLVIKITMIIVYGILYIYSGCDKNGICVVKKSKQKEWLERLNTLEDQIKYWTDPENMTDKTIEIIHLYFSRSTYMSIVKYFILQFKNC